jgi:hypothetical protein
VASFREFEKRDDKSIRFNEESNQQLLALHVMARAALDSFSIMHGPNFKEQRVIKSACAGSRPKKICHRFLLP